MASRKLAAQDGEWESRLKEVCLRTLNAMLLRRRCFASQRGAGAEAEQPGQGFDSPSKRLLPVHARLRTLMPRRVPALAAAPPLVVPAASALAHTASGR